MNESEQCKACGSENVINVPYGVRCEHCGASTLDEDAMLEDWREIQSERDFIRREAGFYDKPYDPYYDDPEA